MTDRTAGHPPSSAGRRRTGPLADTIGVPLEAADSHAGPRAGSPKAELRTAILRRRRERLRRDPAGVTADGAALAAHLLAAPELAGLLPGATVAAYLELPTEVPALPVRRALDARGIRVLVPVLLPDLDLDWTSWPAPAAAGASPRADVREAAIILLPGVAGDLDGRRLGRGGGSYDRVLNRLPPPGSGRPWTCLLLFADELVVRVPVEPHDVAVDAVATPAGVHRIGRV